MSHVRKGSLRECSSAPVNLCAGCAEEALRQEPGSCASPSFLQMESDRERDCLGPRDPEALSADWQENEATETPCF